MTGVAPPEPQHIRHLRLANEVRLGRTAVKRRVAAGEATLREALAHPHVQTALVADVLMWQRRWGRARALRALRHAGASEFATVGGLTDRQRWALVAWAKGPRRS